MANTTDTSDIDGESLRDFLHSGHINMKDLLVSAAKSWRDEAERQREMMEMLFYMRASSELMDKLGCVFVVHYKHWPGQGEEDEKINAHLALYMKSLRMEAYNKAALSYMFQDHGENETHQDP